MSRSRRFATSRLRELPPLLFLAGAQLVIGTLALRAGPVAISDDDFARVVIAQQFVESPTLDPTGTSWLPLPFFITGISMMATEATLLVAQNTQLVLAVLAVAALYTAARLLGARRSYATAASLLAITTPYAARLSVATVPEYPTAAMMTLAMSAAAWIHRAPSSASPGQRATITILGAAAAAAATACRYESWPVALGYTLLCFAKTLGLLPRNAQSPANPHIAWSDKLHRGALLAAGGLASSFVIAWLLHGVFRHGDALFFVRRVVDYKQALGAEPPALLESLTQGYLAAAFRFSAQVWLVAIVSLALCMTACRRRAMLHLSALTLPFGLAALMLATLTYGDLRSGAPTHHPERAVLSIWMLASVTAGALLSAWSRSETASTSIPSRIIAGGALVTAITVGTLSAAQPGGFAMRDEELAIGRQLALHPHTEAVLLATPDYGYFAIEAAAGHPSRFVIADKRDPRDPRSPLSDRALAQQRASSEDVQLVVAPGEWENESWLSPRQDFLAPQTGLQVFDHQLD